MYAGWLELDVLPNKRYSFTVRHTGAARHYKLGTSHAQLSLGQSGIRYLRGEDQTWEIAAAADEMVQIQVSTDAANLNEGAVQATRVTLTMRGAATGASEQAPDRTLIPASTEVFTFLNGSSDGTLALHVEADGHFRLGKVGGDEHLYTLPCSESDEDQPALAVTITDAGVEPSELRISVGQRVQIVNNSSRVHQIQSDPHPIHTNCPPLNQPGRLAPGDSGLTAAFTEAGSCGFHDHLSPVNRSLQGRIVVGTEQTQGAPEGGSYGLSRR